MSNSWTDEQIVERRYNGMLLNNIKEHTQWCAKVG